VSFRKKMSVNGNRILLMVLLVLLCSLRSLSALEVGQLSQEPILLAPHLEFIADPGHRLTLEELLKQETAAGFQTNPGANEALDFGYTDSTYWLRLELTNTSDQAREYQLEIASSSLTSVVFYLPTTADGYTIVKTGSVEPFSSRAYPNRFFAFPISFAPNTTLTFYFQIQSTNAVLIPATLWDRESFQSHERMDYMIQALYFGMALAMILFNLLLYIVLRDFGYLLYVAFIACATLTVAMTNGLTKEFFWPGAAQWTDSSTYIGFSLSLATLFIFLRNMLDTASKNPKIDPLLKLFVGILFALPVGYLFFLPALASFSAVFNPIMALVILGVGVFCAFQRNRSAYFFVGAFSVLIFGGLVTTLRDWTLLPTNLVTNFGLQFGLSAQMILLAIALADRFNTLRREVRKNLERSNRELEQKVKERTLELKEVIATKDRFFSIMAHDLRGPLSGMNSLSTLLKERLDDKQSVNIHEYLQLFINSSGKVHSLLENLLEWAKTQTGTVPFHPQTEDLPQVIQESLSLVENLAIAKGITVKMELGGPLEVFADRNMLSCIVRNLLTNAIKFTSQGGNIRVTACATATGLEISVQDDGIGIPEAHMPTLFRIDSRHSTLGTNKETGTGLGLILCKEFVEKHGGTIQVESQVGQGSRFFFTLPTTPRPVSSDSFGG